MELGVEIQKQLDERNVIETRLKEALREPGRKEVVSEFKALVSSFPKEMGNMQNQLSTRKLLQMFIHCGQMSNLFHLCLTGSLESWKLYQLDQWKKLLNFKSCTLWYVTTKLKYTMIFPFKGKNFITATLNSKIVSTNFCLTCTVWQSFLCSLLPFHSVMEEGWLLVSNGSNDRSHAVGDI
ncbi:uncharacterized protein LOC124932924 [Impatiens glandulifera]|uniref:uncharacterized protein LOC124932924 n=1 Tax=Impatiens glandulifera TaxID=253017 RepID=UPI001FB08938|nr:uncharacterized protein LOC124932924 [Impatiens glandulifera]